MKKRLSLTIFLVLIIRFLFSFLPPFEIDQNVWKFWSNRLVDLGPANFYSQQIFTDYTPGFLYVFWLVGVIRYYLLTPFLNNDLFFNLLLKLPMNLADFASGYIIYLFITDWQKTAIFKSQMNAKRLHTSPAMGESIGFLPLDVNLKHKTPAFMLEKFIKKKLSEKLAITGFLLYTLNPLVIFNASIWGQFDGFVALLVLLSIYFIKFNNNLYLALALIAIAWTMKPQVIAFAPFYLLWLFKKYKITTLLKSIALALLLVLAIYLPFFPNNPLYGIFYVHERLANVYNCTTCFSFNFWGLLGNWRSDSEKFIGIPYLFWGVILTIISYIFIFFVGPFKKRFQQPYLFLTAAISLLAFWMFITRMHERYLFAFFGLFIIACFLLKDKILFVFYLLFSIIFTINLYTPYAYYQTNSSFVSQPLTLPLSHFFLDNFEIMSAISFILFILLLIYFIKIMYKRS